MVLPVSFGLNFDVDTYHVPAMLPLSFYSLGPNVYVDVLTTLPFVLTSLCRSFRGLEKPNEVSELRKTLERPAALNVSTLVEEVQPKKSNLKPLTLLLSPFPMCLAWGRR